LAKKRSLFVTPGTVRLDLDGDLADFWVEIKQGLTFREREVLNAAILTSMPMSATAAGSPQYGVDVARYNLLRLQTYLVEWNFTDDRGKQLDVRRQNIENLAPEVADAVTARLDRYLEEKAAADKAGAAEGAEGGGGKANGSASTSGLSLVSSSPPAGAGGS
jgi:hypothetical protein